MLVELVVDVALLLVLLLPRRLVVMA
jgi:hypothetical protein